ncbi:uncharacterized protein PGTG_07990 [Puccinia graminis f. sp. tritici CRL 75-36-700-3]|uniref:Uncharacterized protein n=1 Tax=Puccinia graminis f. sp. tritici (strain CRL 75-36-700-3 / race SCCL) TaxID=418459 RepID=E3KB15_PUCGT|nr:uncharacterized protein PGTG_07990 [Puccinia graminis f. sp. tritici CRL 75-36-700-3]EFP81741.1 hypothetical protein PGTG_07990 [Puccinia graminis f. sp. tritici CRL 75-36-700-3]
MASSLQSWLLGSSFILTCLLKLSTASPPLSIYADSELPSVSAVGRRPEGSSIPFEALSIFDRQPDSKRQKTTIDFFGDLGDLGDGLHTGFGTPGNHVAQLDAPIESVGAAGSNLSREWRGSPVPHSSIDKSEHNTVSQVVRSSAGTPGDFEIRILNAQWAHILALTRKTIRKQDNPPDMTKIMQRLDKEIRLVQSALRHGIVEEKFELKGLPITVMIVRHRSTHRNPRRLLIKLDGLRPDAGSSHRRLEDTKNRMANILEALEYFHRLAREQGVDEKIFGPQIKNIDTDLNQWFSDILFEKTEDSYPLFGRFSDEFISKTSPEASFGSVQKAISKVLMYWKRPKVEKIYEVALSLLGYWYEINASKLGRDYLKNNPENYWSLMAQLVVEKAPRDGRISREYDQGEDFFTTNLKRYMIGKQTRQKWDWDALFELVDSRQVGSSMTKDIRDRIEAKTKSSGISRKPKVKEFETPIAGLPIYLIRALQPKHGPRMQKVRIILSQSKQWRRRRANQLSLLQRRIFLIYDSLDILHKIASEQEIDTKLLGSSVTDTQEKLMNWFLEVLFIHTEDSLPIFGTVRIPFPTAQPPAELFGAAQKYLSIMLTSPGKITRTHTNDIAFLLLGFWYEEVASKHGKEVLGLDAPHSYWKCMNQLSQKIKTGLP